MDAKYLTINGLHFNDNAIYDGKTYRILPSSVVPTSDIIKTTERSLSGKMSVDITAIKKKLSITFDMLSDRDFNFIRRYLSLESIKNIDPDGIEVTYFDFYGLRQEKTITCFVDNVSYRPFIIEDEIMWQNVKIELVEI